MLSIALLAAALISAAPTENDELCSAIGKTSQAALQPRDRIFFEKSCVCAVGECAEKGGKRAGQLLARAAAERPGLFRESEAAVMAAARAFSACSRSPDSVSCLDEANLFGAECERHERAFPENLTPCAIGDWEARLK
jgi:hypothetical protein